MLRPYAYGYIDDMQIAAVSALPRDDEQTRHCEEPVKATRQSMCNAEKQMKGRSLRSLRSLAMTNSKKQSRPSPIVKSRLNRLCRQRDQK